MDKVYFGDNSKRYIKVRLDSPSRLVLVKSVLESIPLREQLERVNITKKKNSSDLTIWPTKNQSKEELDTLKNGIELVVVVLESNPVLNKQLFDEEILAFLENYSISEKFYLSGREFFLMHDCHHALDDFRKSLEELLKSVLCNKKSLENQREEFSVSLKSRGYNQFLINGLWVIIDNFAHFQNNHVKHADGDQVKSPNLEYIVEFVPLIIKVLKTVL